MFEKLVDPESVEPLLRDGSLHQSLRHAHIEYVLAYVQGESPAQIFERVATVAELAATHGAVVHDLVGPLVIAAFGTNPALPPQSGSCNALVAALREQLGGDVKVVHGAADGHCGLGGNERWMYYTFLVPKFDAVIGVLSRLEFGQIEEFRH